MLFVNAPQLYIDALSGNDKVDVRAPAQPSGAAWNTQVTVAAGSPAGQPGLNGDDFTLETPGAGNQVTWEPDRADGGLFSLTQSGGNADSTVITLASFTIPSLGYTSSAGGFESATYDGQAGNAGLTVLGTGGNDTIARTPGAADDAGTIGVNNLLALNYKNLGSGTLTVNGNGGADDTLVVNGTAGVDSFDVAAITGTVQVNADTPIQQTGIANLTLNGLAGDNTYSVAAGQPYSAITINGSGNSDPDVLNLTGDGSPVTVTLDGANPSVSGGGLGVISLTGVGIVNLNNGAGAINVLGTTGQDNFSITPTGASTATIQNGASAPVLNTDNTGNLNITEGTAGDGDSVTVNGTSNSETIHVQRGPTTTVQVGGLKTVGVSQANVASLIVNGGLGADIFNVNGAFGPELTVEGGQTPAADTLNLSTGDATVSFGTDPSSGSVDTSYGIVNFVNFQTANLNDDGTSSLTINATNGNDAIQQLNNQVTVNNGTVIGFDGYVGLTLNGLAGNDQFNVSPATLVDLTTFTTDGGTSSAGDALVVNGTASQNAIGFTPTSANVGSVSVDAAPVVDFMSIGNVMINGQGGDDSLTAATPVGTNGITYTPGATVDAASVQVGSLVPMSFTNLGGGGDVTLDDAGATRADNLTYNGTSAVDAFTVDAGGDIHLNSQLVVHTPGVNNLTLNGLAGDNTYSISASQPYGAITVNGSGNSDPDVLTLTGDGSLVTVTLGGATQTVSGGGLGTVNVTGVGIVNLSNGVGNITVDGTSAPDAFNVTPTSATGATIQTNGLAPVLNATTSGALLIDGAGGSNTVTVNGTANNDTIATALDATTTSVTVGAFLPISLASADTHSLVLSGGAGDDAYDFTGTSGPAGVTVTGGNGSNAINLPGTAGDDSYNVNPGSNNASGSVSYVLPGGASPIIAFSGVQNLGVDGGVTGNDTLSINGTGADDTINLQGTGPGAGTAQVNGGPLVTFAALGSDPGTTINLNGAGGADAFNITQPGNWQIAHVSVSGGTPGAGGSLLLNASGTAGTDAFTYMSTGPQAGMVGLTSDGSATSYALTNVAQLNLNELGPANASLSVTNANAVITPSATPNSGTVTTTDVGNTTALLPLTYSNIATVSASGTSVVINAPEDGDTVTISPTGLVTVTSAWACRTRSTPAAIRTWPSTCRAPTTT